MRIRTGLVPGLLLALSVVGCGTADNGNGVATAGGPATTSSAKPGGQTEKDALLEFAKCMRRNGVPDFPDPEFGDGGGVSLNLPEGVDKHKVDAAQEKCKQYMPNGGEAQKADPQVVEQLRKYSQCMRENGVPNFPDPTDQGLQIDNDKLGMNPDDPRFKTADQACAKLMPAPPSGGGAPTRSNG